MITREIFIVNDIKIVLRQPNTGLSIQIIRLQFNYFGWDQVFPNTHIRFTLAHSINTVQYLFCDS